MQRRSGLGISGGEELDRLRLAVLDDLEVVRRETGDRATLLVGDDHAEVDEVDAGAERLLLRRPPRASTREQLTETMTSRA